MNPGEGGGWRCLANFAGMDNSQLATKDGVMRMKEEKKGGVKKEHRVRFYSFGFVSYRRIVVSIMRRFAPFRYTAIRQKCQTYHGLVNAFK